MTDAARLPISAYIRTLNEERMIAEVVRAASAVADEVIVVDSGSTDATRDLARAEGATVIDQPWLGNGFQKRAGEEAARNDWLLDLDADEIVSEELAASIRALFANGAPEGPVYALDLCLQPPGRKLWRDFFNVPRAKLYDRRRLRMPEHKAWDQLQGLKPSALTLLDGPLIHHGFADFKQVVTKMNSVSSVRAREAKMKPLWQLRLRLVFGFPAYFFKQYIGKKGWKGGMYGFALCAILSLARWLRDAKMYEAQTDPRNRG
ncbi:glycosyltransferase family 2 protein [Rhodovulum sp. DZ06]|uniref:glycosyltransferase family 2 protein n=1 Tax=Rhodovulum sp. DZ06 TaxID=3425126 RepID=UPI003D337F82